MRPTLRSTSYVSPIVISTRLLSYIFRQKEHFSSAPNSPKNTVDIFTYHHFTTIRYHPVSSLCMKDDVQTELQFAQCYLPTLCWTLAKVNRPFEICFFFLVNF